MCWPMGHVRWRRSRSWWRQILLLCTGCCVRWPIWGCSGSWMTRLFELASLGELLRTEVEGSLRGWATMVGMRFARDSWTDLYMSVKTGEPAFERVHGEDLFSYLAKHPDDAAIFNEAMRFVSTGVLTGLVEAYDFSRFRTIVDV